METALDVLSRAATMVQDSTGTGDLRLLPKKELPTAKWRRERRYRAEVYHTSMPTNTTQPDSYKQQQNCSNFNAPLLKTMDKPASSKCNLPLVVSPLPSQSPSHLIISATTAFYPHSILNEKRKLNEIESQQDDYGDCESPIDMTISPSIKHNQAESSENVFKMSISRVMESPIARPSVITQAPSKRELDHSDNKELYQVQNQNTESLSMCDTVIDEHFRRSLGPDYVSLISKRLPVLSTINAKPLSALAKVTPHSIIGQLQHDVDNLPESHALSKELVPSPLTTSSNADKLTILGKISTPPDTNVAVKYLSSQNEGFPCHFSSEIIFTQPKSNNTPSLTTLTKTSTEFTNEVLISAPSFQNAISITSTASHYPTNYAFSAASIKTESNLNHFNISTTNTPPASPNSNKSHSKRSSDVIASVDDHFAKALGDAWKKLKENDDARNKVTNKS